MIHSNNFFEEKHVILIKVKKESIFCTSILFYLGEIEYYSILMMKWNLTTITHIYLVHNN